MAKLRAFTAVVRVAVESDSEDEVAVSVDGLREYLAEAVVPVLRDEDCGNPYGVSSVELVWESLLELSGDAVDILYGRST